MTEENGKSDVEEGREENDSVNATTGNETVEVTVTNEKGEEDTSVKSEPVIVNGCPAQESDGSKETVEVVDKVVTPQEEEIDGSKETDERRNFWDGSDTTSSEESLDNKDGLSAFANVGMRNPVSTTKEPEASAEASSSRGAERSSERASSSCLVLDHPFESTQKFGKDVPVDPSATSDLSVQPDNPNYNNKCLSWLEGTVYQKKVGECLQRKTIQRQTGQISRPGKSVDTGKPWEKRNIPTLTGRRKNEQMLNFVIPPTVMMPGKFIRGDGFFDFSIMPVWNMRKFESLQAILQNCAKTELRSRKFAGPCIVKYCINETKKNAKEEWYRGVITKVPEFPWGSVEVYLIDVGTYEQFSPYYLFELPTELSSKDPLAIQVRCLNVNVNNDHPKVVKLFNTLVRDSWVKMRLTHNDETKKFRYGCILYVNYMDKWFDAGLLMKSLQIGDKASPKAIAAEEESKYITPFKSTPHQDETLPSSDDKIPVKITHVNAVNDFYVILDTDAANNKRRELQQDMDSLLEAKNPVKAMKHLNHPLFAWRDTNNEWIRVKVIEVAKQMPGPDVLVRKMETGETLTIPFGELKQLPPHLQVAGVCAYKCSLPLKPNPYNRKEARLFQSSVKDLEKIMNADCKVHLKLFSVQEQNLDKNIVDLYKEGKSLSKDLIFKGLYLAYGVQF